MESPARGNRQLVSDANDINASPYGWHDTNAVDGAEFTITLPNGPTGTVFIVKDVSGDANTNPITVINTVNIDGQAGATIDTSFGSLTFVYSNGAWNII